MKPSFQPLIYHINIEHVKIIFMLILETFILSFISSIPKYSISSKEKSFILSLIQ